jgi:hypothetical protein
VQRYRRRDILLGGMSLGLALGTSQLAAEELNRNDVPIGLDLDFEACGLSVLPKGDRYEAAYDLRRLIPHGFDTATRFYVDGDAGADGNDGLTWDRPFRSIYRALNIGNATERPYRVMVRAGVYDRPASIGGMDGVVEPTQDICLEAVGGRVVTGNFDRLDWTPDATFTHCFRASRSGVGRVVDLTRATRYGDHADLIQVATAAECDGAPGSWAMVGPDLYVNGGGRPVTDDNTRAYMNLTTECFLCGEVNVVAVGFDFEGGRTRGAISAQRAAKRNLVFVDCTAKYAGHVTLGSNGISVTDTDGYVVLERFVGAANTADAINVHWTLGEPAKLKLVTIDCHGRDGGRYTNTSNNGLTLHEGIVGVDIGGRYMGNRGANVHIIDSARLLCIGTVSESSYGDRVVGGSIESCSYMTGNTSQMWLLGVTGAHSLHALYAQGDSIIHKRETQVEGRESTSSNGVITTW